MIAPAKTRIIRSHEEWNPHGYQVRAVQHLIARRSAALFLDPGLGKTACVLAAFQMLKNEGMINRMLVIAPLRVCQLVWAQEGRKWTQFRDLTFSLLHGPKKDQRLQDQVDIHLINPEGIAWLANKFYGWSSLPWDIVTVDEITKFKNARAQRSKKLRKRLGNVQYRWGLTGSPAPNGYMDLFGQMLLLDDGAALGRYITHFRDQYFTKGFDGFTYELKPDGAARIEKRIAPYVLRMSADDYLELPELQDNVIEIELPKEARKHYNEMKKEMIISLPEGVVTAANSAAVYTKLSQLANGAIYINESEYVEIHTAKLDALEDLIEELAGQPLLVGYEFQHDLHRLQERFPNIPTLTGKSHKQIVEIEAAWNNGELPALFAHPASAGHGLNLQGSGAAHLCWFSQLWDLDLYIQFIRRLLRQGTTAKRIMNHVLIVKNSIDETKRDRLKEKNVTQKSLLDALNAEIIRDEDTPREFGYTTTQEEEEMGLRKLPFQNQQQEGGASDAAAPATPKGWGPPASAATATAPAPAENESDAPARPKGGGPPAGAATGPAEAQRENISSKLRAPAPEPDGDDDEPPVAERAMQAFSGVQGLTSAGPAPEGEERAETTAAGQSADGAPLPAGWGPRSTGTGTAGSQPAAAEPAAGENPPKTARYAGQERRKELRTCRDTPGARGPHRRRKRGRW